MALPASSAKVADKAGLSCDAERDGAGAGWYESERRYMSLRAGVVQPAVRMAVW